MMGYLIAGLALLNLVSFGMGLHYGGKSARQELAQFKQKVENEAEVAELAWLARINAETDRANKERDTARVLETRLAQSRKLVSDTRSCDFSRELVGLWHDASSYARNPSVTGESNTPADPVPAATGAATYSEADIAAFVEQTALAYADVMGQRNECIWRYEAVREAVKGN